MHPLVEKPIAEPCLQILMAELETVFSAPQTAWSRVPIRHPSQSLEVEGSGAV